MRQFDVENIEGSIDLRGTKLLIHIYGSGGIGAKLRENDWLRTNFMALPIMGVHVGYLAAACRVYREAAEELKTATQVVVTGHSMGGAIAEVLGTLIAWFRKIPVEAHNFGGPAPWSRIFLARLAGIGVDHHWQARAARLEVFQEM